MNERSIVEEKLKILEGLKEQLHIQKELFHSFMEKYNLKDLYESYLKEEKVLPDILENGYTIPSMIQNVEEYKKQEEAVKKVTLETASEIESKHIEAGAYYYPYTSEESEDNKQEERIRYRGRNPANGSTDTFGSELAAISWCIMQAVPLTKTVVKAIPKIKEVKLSR